MTDMIDRATTPITDTTETTEATEKQPDFIKQWDIGAIIFSVAALLSAFLPFGSWDARIDSASLSIFVPILFVLAASISAYTGTLQTRRHSLRRNRGLERTARFSIWGSLVVLLGLYLITFVPRLIAL